MSVNFFKKLGRSEAGAPAISARRRTGAIVGFAAWVVASFVVAQLLVVGLVLGLNWLGVSFVLIDPAVLNSSVAAVTYALSLLIAIGVPMIIKKRDTTSLRDLGLWRLPSWGDIGLAPVGFIVYFLLSAVLLYIVTQLTPGFNSAQPQEIGFENLAQRYEYLLAFVTLVVIAPVAEETLFRGYLYGKLKKFAPLWLAVFVTSLVFAALHLPGGESLQWNVALDVFALSIILCSLREVTGSIWAGILLHMLKNGLAFYLLFINPTFLHTIGQ